MAMNYVWFDFSANLLHQPHKLNDSSQPRKELRPEVLRLTGHRVVDCPVVHSDARLIGLD